MFEVSKSLEHLRVKEVVEDSRGPTRTSAEQKMDRNLKKLRKSIKVPKWNPSDWKIGEKLKMKINTRAWEDINVGSGWAELESRRAEDKKGRQDGGRRELLSQSDLRYINFRRDVRALLPEPPFYTTLPRPLLSASNS